MDKERWGDNDCNWRQSVKCKIGRDKGKRREEGLDVGALSEPEEQRIWIL